jgi:hypothetical protein
LFILRKMSDHISPDDLERTVHYNDG